MESSRMRSFDPRSVGALECRAWETYYRRKWLAFLLASVGLVRQAFRMSWPRTLVGAWLVLRANQKWTPFYRLLKASENAPFDPARAAELEVDWWRAHRDNQHAGGDGSVRELEETLTALYAYTYSADTDEVRAAAVLRARAMDVSDRWVEAGRDQHDPLLGEERALLVRSYAALLAAVHR